MGGDAMRAEILGERGDDARAPILQAVDVDKTFPGVHAVDHVSLAIEAGEIHAIVGENGAGKSTLMQILAGVYRPDSGQLLLEGQPVTFATRHDAEMRGIGIVFQELSLAPNLSVAENIFAGRQPINGLGLVRRSVMRREAQRLLDLFGLGLDARMPAHELSLGNRQIVEIAKALSLDARVLILDEPTSSLSRHESRTLFTILRGLRDRGIAVIYISHHLEEVFALTDRVTVLRDGKWVATVPTAETDEETIVSLMVGRALQAVEQRVAATRGMDERAAPALAVRGLSRASEFTDISFTVRRGEIVGMAGLVGAGRTEVAQAICGLTRLDRGEIVLEGRQAHIRRPSDAIAHGLAYLSEDRKELGLFLRMTLTQNVAAPNLDRLGRLGFVDDRRARAMSRDYMGRLRIRTPSPDAAVGTLSGGNQQKVLLSAWLATRPRVLIVDEPTRGIDVGAKAEIHTLLGSLADTGVAILMISSDLPEILTLSDRVLVLSRGRLAGEYTRAEATEENIMARAAGLQAPALAESAP